MGAFTLWSYIVAFMTIVAFTILTVLGFKEEYPKNAEKVPAEDKAEHH